MAKKEKPVESSSDSSTVSSALQPASVTPTVTPVLEVMSRTREEMSEQLRHLLATVRQSVLAEVEVMQHGVAEAALLEVADRLVELNRQLSNPKSPMSIVLLPALRQKATVLSQHLSLLYQRTGLPEGEATALAKQTVRDLVPNCPA